jgi:putative transcriptional regulator
MPNRRGKFLIASPQLQDPNFVRTVVLIVREEEEGVLGLVLNRPLEVTVADACGQTLEAAANVEQPLYLGGPCGGQLTVLYASAFGGGDEVVPGVQFAVEQEQIESLMWSGSPSIRYFAGYSGWGPQQLDGELDAGAWHLVPASADLVLDGGKSLWSKLTTWISMGRKVDIERIPDDPSLN